MVNVFGGGGFVGSAYVSKFNNCIVNEKYDYVPKTDNILYFISTTDNYNIFDNPHIDIDTNLTTLIKVLENIKNKNNTTFNFISSWFVYGNTDLPAYEESYCDPRGFYSITKRAAEQLLISYCETYEIKYRILRLANVIGTGDKKVSKKKNALTYLINELKQDNTINLYSDGDLYRDYIDLDDCVEAINLVLTKGGFNSIYNIGNGTPIKLKYVIDFCKNYMNSNSEINNIDAPRFHKLVQVKSMYMNTDKLKLLGYRQKYEIRDILERLINEK